MIPSIAKVLRLASFLICAIVVASFAVFAVERTDTASRHQQELLGGGSSRSSSGSAPASPRQSAAHRRLEEASNALTSPFTGLLRASKSEWATRTAKLVLALLLYGLGLGYLARALRIRV